MMRYFAARLAWALPTLFAILTLTFFLVRTAPGGPFDEERALPPDIRRNLDAAYGLDQPLWVQFGHYLARVAHGDFGPSFKYRDFSVTELIAQGFPISAGLGISAMALALVGGIAAGTFAALRRREAGDRLAMAAAVLGITVPTFVLLPFLALVFGVYLKWLPVAGWEPGSLRYFVLPVLALALPPLAVISRLTRASMIEVLDSDYVRTARAKGLSPAAVIWRHALPPALIPVAGYLAPALAAIMTGSLVVESIAGLPGIGRYLVQGALNRDYTLVLGMVVVYSTLLILMGLIVDLIFALLDPRVRFRA
ncbi:MAG: ABC transporter permease subunit [Proteobacteria bacterium]|nr:ABC transporter permease subunit [Pseudomonadota bacterium]